MKVKDQEETKKPIKQMIKYYNNKSLKITKVGKPDPKLFKRFKGQK
tara:strand:- start:147 stop:284 length:138 start_codon:yes stop_codon:yes gene_type:complete